MLSVDQLIFLPSVYTPSSEGWCHEHGSDGFHNGALPMLLTHC